MVWILLYMFWHMICRVGPAAPVVNPNPQESRKEPNIKSTCKLVVPCLSPVYRKYPNRPEGRKGSKQHTTGIS